MKFFVEKPTVGLTAFFRRAGYHFLKRGTEELAFAKKLTEQEFPRFHAFAKIKDNQLEINIHLDHKKASHKGVRAHSGEYGRDSKLLKEEIDRLKKWACSSSGRALHSHCRGKGFESPQVQK